MMCTAGRNHLTAGEFEAWLATAKTGERIAYAVGILAGSIHVAWKKEHPDAWKLSALQEVTGSAGAKGHFYRVERRLKPGVFEYIAERAQQP